MKVRVKLLKPGRIVPDPSTGKPVSPSGLEVKLDADGRLPKYWRRRIADGDVALDEPQTLTQLDISLED